MQKIKPEFVEKFTEYANWTVTTSIHKTHEDAIACCVLGIGGEYHELMDKISPYIFGNIPREEMDEWRRLTRKEFGDVFYYLGHLLYRLNLLGELTTQIPRFSISYKDIFTVQEHMKKVIRDTHYDVSNYKKRNELVSLLVGLVGGLIEDASDYGFDVFEILNENREKLESRLERNAIGGHGDER